MGKKHGDRVDADPRRLGLCRVAVSRLLAPIPNRGRSVVRRGDARRAILSESGAKEVADRGARGRRRALYARGDDDSRRILSATFRLFLAIADVVAIWFFFEEERQESAAQSVALRYKMEKFQEESLRACEEAVKKAQAEEKEREEKV